MIIEFSSSLKDLASIL